MNFLILYIYFFLLYLCTSIVYEQQTIYASFLEEETLTPSPPPNYPPRYIKLTAFIVIGICFVRSCHIPLKIGMEIVFFFEILSLYILKSYRHYHFRCYLSVTWISYAVMASILHFLKRWLKILTVSFDKKLISFV